jgi:hypothetical protein
VCLLLLWLCSCFPYALLSLVFALSCFQSFSSFLICFFPSVIVDSLMEEHHRQSLVLQNELSLSSSASRRRASSPSLVQRSNTSSLFFQERKEEKEDPNYFHNDSNAVAKLLNPYYKNYYHSNHLHSFSPNDGFFEKSTSNDGIYRPSSSSGYQRSSSPPVPAHGKKAENKSSRNNRSPSSRLERFSLPSHSAFSPERKKDYDDSFETFYQEKRNNYDLNDSHASFEGFPFTQNGKFVVGSSLFFFLYLPSLSAYTLRSSICCKKRSISHCSSTSSFTR